MDSAFFGNMTQISQIIASKEQELKTEGQQLGANASPQDLLKFQANMNAYNQFVEMVSNTESEQAKTIKSVIDNVH